MITPGYCRVMARYNHWQNAGIAACVAQMSAAELQRDRGAFFGSIHATLNHLLWGDAIWMCRWSDVEKPKGSIADSTQVTATIAEWATARAKIDQAILTWAVGLTDSDVTGDLTWFSGLLGREVTKDRALCVMHFFNHQTHHRGQVHAMLTAAGQNPGATDLFVMPES